MAKISLNKEDYGIKIESDNFYHGDIAPHISNISTNSIQDSLDTSLDIDDLKSTNIDDKHSFNHLSIFSFFIGMLFTVGIYSSIPVLGDFIILIDDIFYSFKSSTIFKNLLECFSYIPTSMYFFLVGLIFVSIRQFFLYFKNFVEKLKE